MFPATGKPASRLDRMGCGTLWGTGSAPWCPSRWWCQCSVHDAHNWKGRKSQNSALESQESAQDIAYSELVLGGPGNKEEDFLCGSASGFWNESQWEAPGLADKCFYSIAHELFLLGMSPTYRHQGVLMYLPNSSRRGSFLCKVNSPVPPPWRWVTRREEAIGVERIWSTEQQPRLPCPDNALGRGEEESKALEEKM